MKKVILAVFLIIVLSGCSTQVNYNFKKDVIESTISADFTIDEYFDEVSSEDVDENMNNSQKEEMLLNNKSSIILNAFNNNNEIEYEEVIFDKNNYNYSALYKYDYNYSNIINSYLFNCFENFKYEEDEDYYNFELSGKYTCNNKFKLNISSDFGIDNSNSIEIKNGVHSFDIYENNNKIVFSVRKHRFDNVNTTKTIRIIAFVIMVIMLIITFVCYKIAKNNS